MVRFVLSVLLALAGCDRVPPRPGIPPRNLLLITVEGMRADHCSAYLYYRDTTASPSAAERTPEERPLALDDLAQAGVLFTQAFAPTGRPLDSLAALLTGREEGPTLPPGTPIDLGERHTLAEGFALAGMETVAFVTRPEPLPAALGRGFERLEVSPDDWETARRAVEYFAERDWGNGRGLFLWLHLAQPAPPYWPVAPENVRLARDYTRLFTDEDYGGERDGEKLWARAAAGEKLGPEELRYLTDLYDGELALNSHLLTSLVDFLRYSGVTSGAWDRTVTIVAGVSGAELGERAGLGPGESLHDSSLRIPLLLHHPDSLTGRRIFAEPVALVDLAFTITDWFRLDQGPAGEASLLSITDSYIPRSFPSRPVLAGDGRGSLSLRTNDWRLIVDRGGEVELYRVQRMQELSGDVAEEHPEVVQELLARLHTMVGDN